VPRSVLPNRSVRGGCRDRQQEDKRIDPRRITYQGEAPGICDLRGSGRRSGGREARRGLDEQVQGHARAGERVQLAGRQTKKWFLLLGKEEKMGSVPPIEDYLWHRENRFNCRGAKPANHLKEF